MASSVKRLETLLIVLLMSLSIQLVRPEQSPDLKQLDLKSLLDLLDKDLTDNTDAEDKGYARDNGGNAYNDDSISDEDIPRSGTVPPSPAYFVDDDEGYNSEDTGNKYNNLENGGNRYNGDEAPDGDDSISDKDIPRSGTVPPLPAYFVDDDEGYNSEDTGNKYNNLENGGNRYNDDETPDGDDSINDEDILRSGTVSPSPAYYVDDDEGYDLEKGSNSYYYGDDSIVDKDISRLDTVPPLSAYNNMINSDRTASSTDRTFEDAYFPNNNMQGIESQEGNEEGEEAERSVVVPTQLQQQEWQEQQQNQEGYQTGGLQQQTFLNSSASLSSQNQGLSNISLSAPSNYSSNESDSNEQSNPVCSTELNLNSLCNLSMYLTNISNANSFTFSSLENTISNYTTRQSLKRCQPGQWCLGTNVIEGTLENFPKPFCQSSLLLCLENVVEQLNACPAYQKYTTILSSLNLVCVYFEQDPELDHGTECGVPLLEMISVTLSDMEREIPEQEQKSELCKSRTDFMQSGFRCLVQGCSVLEKTSAFRSFPPWQWFMASLASHKQCPLNCTGGKLFEVKERIIKSTEETTKNTLATLPTFTASTTSTTSETDGGDVAGLQYNALHNSEKTGRSFHFLDPWNIGLIATAVAVLLIIIITITVATVFDRLKKRQRLKSQGYSKLKTGEC